MGRRILILTAWLAVAAAAPRWSWADVLVLQNGGRIEGEVLDAEASSRREYVLRTPLGVKITVDAGQVEQRLRLKPAELEYERVAPGYPDTVEGQLKLAAWCLERGLAAQRRAHLERVVELDSDHAMARSALGYQKEDGKWTTREDLMKSRGYIYHKGKWRLPQEIEVLSSKDKQDKLEREWVAKLARWQNMLGTERDLVARDAIRNISEPGAVRALSALLHNEKTPPKNRCLCLEALAKIGSRGAIDLMASVAVNDAVEEVRLTSLDYLKKRKDTSVVSFFVGKLRSTDNRVVNRAGIALSYMNDRSAIGPLVDAIITVHKYKLVSGSSNPGSMSNTFSSSGPGTFSAGSSSTIVKQEVRNQAVLDALVMLSGVNYGFDPRAWRTWYATQKQRQAIDARRD